MYLIPHLDRSYLISLLLIILAEFAAMAGVVRLIMGRIDRHRRRVGFPVLIPIVPERTHFRHDPHHQNS